jgi:hypothetical protein
MPDLDDCRISVSHSAFKESSVFNNVSKYMHLHDPEAPKWMIEAPVGVDIDGILISYIVHFNYDGRSVVYSSGSSGIRAGDQRAVRELSAWLIENGWRRPEPSPGEADAARDFWKELWITGVVDSNYLQSKYGRRKIFDES